VADFQISDLSRARPGWRWFAAFALFGFAMLGQGMGVELSERLDTPNGWLTRAYYSLGLFVVGGLDLGMPTGGSALGRGMLWIAYFGAPLLTASAVIEAVVRLVAPERWQFRRLNDHIIIGGSGTLTRYYLQVLRQRDTKSNVVVVTDDPDSNETRDMAQSYATTLIAGEIGSEFLLERLRTSRARKILLFGDNDYQSFEAAARIIKRRPKVASRIVLHCHNLRFLRAMQQTELVKDIISFNAYHLAAAGLVREHLLRHFEKTEARDVVVLAGFGRFGQTILEELQELAAGEMATVAVIDTDAERRMLVVDEQQMIHGSYQREVMQGDIANPEVWLRLAKKVDLAVGEPVIVLGTGNTAQNLRTAMWLKRNYPQSSVYVRTNGKSTLAAAVGKEYDIKSISMTQLVEEHMPSDWLS